MWPSPSSSPPPTQPEGGAKRPRDPCPLDPHYHQLQFLKPVVDYWALPVAIGASSLMVTDKGNLLYQLHCALVILIASMILFYNRTGNTKRLPLLFRIHSLFFLGFYMLWILGAATAQPAMFHGDFSLQLFCVPFHLIIGMGDGGVPRFVPVAYVLAHALLLAALHAYLVGKTWPVALGRGVCVELLCVIASIALKRKCKQVYAAYLLRHDRDMAAVLRSKHGGQELEGKDGMTAEGEKRPPFEDTPATSETSKAASHLASKPETGTQSLPKGPLPPPQPCQPSCSSAAGSTTAMPEDSATSSNRVYQSRIRRHQVHIRIEASGLEQVLRHPDFATHFSQRLNEELPGYFAPELAIRVGCIIVSFDLANIEAGLEQKLDDEAALSSPAGKQPMPVSAHSKLSLAREVLLEYGHTLGLPHGTEISVQVDGYTISCKWDAAAHLWVPDNATAPATATRAAGKADQCQIRLSNPILQIPSSAAKQQDQPAHAGQSIPLPVTAGLRGEHAGGRVVQGWDAEPRREEHSTAASDELEGTPETNGVALQLVARTQGRFLPVVMAHQSTAKPDEQLIEVHVMLPPNFAHASDPFAMELELWAQDVCLSSQSALAVPSHLASLAREVSAWAAATVHQAQQDGPPFHPLDDFVCDLAEFLSFCCNREQYQLSQAEAMDAVGRDLLQFASNAKMEVLAAHLRHNIASSLSPDSKGGSNKGMTSSSSSSSSSSKPGTLREGIPPAAGHRHSSQPFTYSDFEYNFLQPLILPWALLVAFFTIAVFLTGEGGLFHFFLSALVLLVAAMMVADNRAGNTERVRLLFRIHSCCFLGYYMMWILGAAAAQRVMLFGDFSLHLFCAPFHLIIGMGDVPRFVPVAHVLAHALLIGAFHVTVGDKSWPAALGRGACVELLCVIATVILKRKCKQMYAAYLQRCDRDLAVACSNKQG